jgi:hypothetical protein
VIYFGEQMRAALKPATNRKGMAPLYGVVTRTTKGARPTTRVKRRGGLWYDPTFQTAPFHPEDVPNLTIWAKLHNQTAVRTLFRKAAALWTSLTAAQKDCWCTRARAAAAKCGCFDFFMRSQLTTFVGAGEFDTGTCCGGPAPLILYASATMGPSQKQTLSLADNTAGPFTWAITQGGGSLSSPDSPTPVYTSPASNPNCTNNATIQVTDRCGRKAYLSIATNIGQLGTDAFRQTNIHCWQHEPAPASFEGIGASGPYNYACFDRYYDCSGAYRRTGAHAGMWTTIDPDPAPNWCNLCMSGESSTIDMRTSAQKAAGCCPSALF